MVNLFVPYLKVHTNKISNYLLLVLIIYFTDVPKTFHLNHDYDLNNSLTTP